MKKHLLFLSLFSSLFGMSDEIYQNEIQRRKATLQQEQLSYTQVHSRLVELQKKVAKQEEILPYLKNLYKEARAEYTQQRSAIAASLKKIEPKALKEEMHALFQQQETALKKNEERIIQRYTDEKKERERTFENLTLDKKRVEESLEKIKKMCEQKEQELAQLKYWLWLFDGHKASTEAPPAYATEAPPTYEECEKELFDTAGPSAPPAEHPEYVDCQKEEESSTPWPSAPTEKTSPVSMSEKDKYSKKAYVLR